MFKTKKANRETKARRNFIGAANNFIGGLENTMEDYKETDPAYMQAQDTLSDHDYLVSVIYSEGINYIYDEKVIYADAPTYLKEIRFLGRNKLMDLADKVVTEMGY